MASRQQLSPIKVHVENIGGIDETDVSLEPGVTVLSGRNATNRTSLLHAIMAALGSDRATVKGDSDEGLAELTFNGETYTRMLKRENGTVPVAGEPYLDDPSTADLFAFLLESNEARQAIATGGDLRELITRPVDTDAIQAEIDDLVDERQRIGDRLDELDSLKRRLPTLEQERAQLIEDIDAKREALEQKEAEIESRNASLEERREQRSELQKKLGELQDLRNELKDTRFELESERDSIEALEDERDEIQAERSELVEQAEYDTGTLNSRLDTLRKKKQELESKINALRNIIQFNEERLNDPSGFAEETLDDSAADGAVTEELLPKRETVCWTCGTTVERERIEQTLEELRRLQQERLEERENITSEIEELESRHQEVQQRKRERQRLDQRLTEIETEIEKRSTRVSELKKEQEGLNDELRALETEVEELEQEDGDLLELHEASNELEFEVGRLEEQLESKKTEIADIEEQLQQERDLQGRREELQEEIASLRTRIKRIEAEAVEQFNTHMDALLDVLNFDNLERIWLEQTVDESGADRREFSLNVVRSTASGSTYMDTIEHLSESEREVTGIVFALAGYMTHEVYEEVPFLLLDSLEAIDASRIDGLLEYISEYPDFVVAALLKEDADVLTLDVHEITDI